MALLALLPTIGMTGCFESGRASLENKLKCYAVAIATERDLTSRIHVRDALVFDGHIPPELEAENQAHRNRDVLRLTTARSIKRQFAATWEKADSDISKTIQKEANRQFEQDRIQFLNGECVGELATQ